MTGFVAGKLILMALHLWTEVSFACDLHSWFCLPQSNSEKYIPRELWNGSFCPVPISLKAKDWILNRDGYWLKRGVTIEETRENNSKYEIQRFLNSYKLESRSLFTLNGDIKRKIQVEPGYTQRKITQAPASI